MTYIDELIAGLDAKLLELNTEVDRLSDIRMTIMDTYGYSYPATPTKPQTIYSYSVPSRSGNDAHIVSYVDGDWSCTCPAGENGRVCWALRGVQESATWYGFSRGGSFGDERGVTRHYTRLAK